MRLRNGILLALCLLPFVACSASKPSPGGAPRTHHYVDKTQMLPPVAGRVLQASIGHFTRARQRGIIILAQQETGQLQFHVLAPVPPEGKFHPIDNPHLAKLAEHTVTQFAAVDFNKDGLEDLVVLVREEKKVVAHLLLNNKKGYFYSMKDAPVLPLAPGVTSVEPVDIDNDLDMDLLFLGHNPTGAGKAPAPRQMQLFINNGKGGFQDLTGTLLPPLPPGIVAPIFADYDSDGNPDIFLIYETGENLLLLNNGLGSFANVTTRNMPRITGKHQHADWADFDEDRDLDILIVTAGLDPEYKNHPGEYNYFLENDGHGLFTKRSLHSLPQIPTRKVYLLDADNNNTVDALFLTRDGPQFYSGYGHWLFNQETREHLPSTEPIDEVIFGDINGDGLLDAIAIFTKNRKLAYWVSVLG